MVTDTVGVGVRLVVRLRVTVTARVRVTVWVRVRPQAPVIVKCTFDFPKTNWSIRL